MWRWAKTCSPPECESASGEEWLYIRRQAFGNASPHFNKFEISEFTLCTAPKALPQLEVANLGPVRGSKRADTGRAGLKIQASGPLRA